MPSSDKLTKFLEEKKVNYTLLRHEKAYTAQEVAHAVHVSGKELAKTIVANADGKFIMVILPAHHRVNLKLLKDVLKAKEVRLAREEEIQQLFPDCELGAMPPLGPLYNMSAYVAKPLLEDKEITFNAGTHTEAIKMNFGDFQQLTNPVVGEFSELPPS